MRKNKARKARLADAERRREAHARLIVERSGDPQFVQRQTDPLTGDRTLSMPAQHPAAQDMRESMQELRRDFTERFGREPGPEDPLFFDPANDVPTPMSPETATAEFDTMLDDMASQIDDPRLRYSGHNYEPPRMSASSSPNRTCTCSPPTTSMNGRTPSTVNQ